jgi:hypothetical protein
MVALVSYACASGKDLAAGRTIAGTGKIRGDVLVFPARQERLLTGFDAAGMRSTPVDSLDDAIVALAGRLRSP